MFKSLVAFASLAIYTASAQSVGGLTLSQSCQTAAATLATGPLAQCVPFTDLLGVVTASGSVVQPINTFLQSWCVLDDCPDSTLIAANQTVQQGCATDLSASQYGPIAAGAVFANFNALKTMACQGYTANSTYCLTDLLTNVQNTTGVDLGLGEVFSVITAVATQSSELMSILPPSIACTDCNSALLVEAYPIVENVTATLGLDGTMYLSGLQGQAQTYCNSTSFAATPLPSDVSELNSTSAAAPSASASSYRFARW